MKKLSIVTIVAALAAAAAVSGCASYDRDISAQAARACADEPDPRLKSVCVAQAKAKLQEDAS
ncbi:hypothetical protein [Parvularcula lutaonensis]|uniref:Entry exclusion lipoprotein TrbK n=1 Tax=Parvularcula lutaonensis TaxID=491923 RepID=A0ABV7MDL7_9PROT|nr:hypothetical protein [Parvularcula lutaonensis]GGY53507.1 hypothetical protein GCM10007148_23450 [Parvularcula lutaonensis]